MDITEAVDQGAIQIKYDYFFQMSVTPLNVQLLTGINFVLLHFLFIGLDYNCMFQRLYFSERCSSYRITFVLFFVPTAKSIPIIICVVFTKIIPGPRLVFCSS